MRNWLREWVIHLLVLCCIICIFLGYFWRMYHETKNWDKWSDSIRQEFLLEITDPNNGVVSYYKNWMIVKRADGSVVIRRR